MSVTFLKRLFSHPKCPDRLSEQHGDHRVPAFFPTSNGPRLRMGIPITLLPCVHSCRCPYVLSDGTCTAGRNLDATMWIKPTFLPSLRCLGHEHVIFPSKIYP